jgi:ankyrin repeat protein
MHSAARVGSIEVMRTIFRHEPTVLNERDEKKLTPLHHAALYRPIDEGLRI